ncbi:MAG: TIGR04219 family outer membrane beta-barrel protein, partial [Enterobacterales bacterium]|nr:TIGR04219 family outer membrane beta-barrel protein [Enterobacterales bacterium]
MSTISRILVLLLVLISSQLKADTLGIYLSASNWKPDISGNIESFGPAISLNETLGFTDDSGSQLSIRFEHPIPGLPNIGIQNNIFDSMASATLNQSITYDGVVYAVNTDVSSTLDFSHQDIILYYEILDNWISLDLGINIMNFDGEFNLVSGSGASIQRSDTTLDELVPALYGMVQFDFPATGIYVGSTLSYIGVDEDNFTKTKLLVGWESEAGLGVEVGYQSFAAEWEDFSDSNGNIDL